MKLFGLDGRTLFSTEAAQIGEDKSNNAGFLSARDGIVISDLSYRDQFNAFENVIADRNMISSYIPLQTSATNNEIQGVFEVYEDVTQLLDRITRAQYLLLAGGGAIFFFFYVVFLLFVRRAENIMRQQKLARDAAEAALQASEQRLRDLVGNAPVVIWTISPDLQVKSVEGRQVKKGTLDLQNYLGQPASQVHPDLANTTKKALAGEDAYSRLDINGTIFDTYFAPVYTDDNNVQSVIAVSTDITDLVQTRGQLNEARENLQNRNQQLERAMEFTRATLGSIQDAVQRGADPSELRVYLSEADTQFQRLN